MKLQNWTRFVLTVLTISLFFIPVDGATVSSTASLAKPKGFYERMLEKFCQKHYNELFEDFWGTRKYVAGSLKVERMRINGQRELNIYGTHEFVGRLGYPTYKTKFTANIYESKKTPNDYVITFEKESKNLVTGEPYIESRTKTFHYEE